MTLVRFLLLLPFRLLGLLFSLLGRIVGLGWQHRIDTGEEYEEFVRYYLERQGFRRVRLTGGTGDLGVDLVARKGGHNWAVQCKYYSYPVGGAAVQEVVAGMKVYRCDRALIVTNSTLTRGAWTLAETNEVDVMEEISPETTFGTSFFLTPKNLVVFTLSCVLMGVLSSNFLPSNSLSPGSFAIMSLLCLLAVWSLLTLIPALLRFFFHP